jgi:hypothetical protein
MFISAEIRWFLRNEPAPGFRGWFMESGFHASQPGGVSERTDEYLQNRGETELGIKIRGGFGGVDIKGLVEVKKNGLSSEPFTGPIEIWTKWRSEYIKLELENTIAVEKERWTRMFDTTLADPIEINLEGRQLPSRGCGVELTRFSVKNETWWTFGFESFGTLETIEKDLRSVASLLASRNPPPLGDAVIHSYPSLLNSI